MHASHIFFHQSSSSVQKVVGFGGNVTTIHTVTASTAATTVTTAVETTP